MTANFLQAKVSSNGMIGIHRKNSWIMLRPTEIHGLIQDLVYARKAISRTSAKNMYLKALIGITVKHMFKEMYVEVCKRCGGCVNEEPIHQSHDYCLLVDPATKATECFDSVFSKVDIYLANELCFEKMQDLIPIPVRDIDLYMN